MTDRAKIADLCEKVAAVSGDHGADIVLSALVELAAAAIAYGWPPDQTREVLETATEHLERAFWNYLSAMNARGAA